MFKKYTLLRSQRNRVYEILREATLEPSEFSWTTETIVDSILVSRLNCRDGTYYFQFSSHDLNSWCVLCPGLYRSLEYEYPKTWDEQEGVFRNWAQYIKREIEAPDLWGELARYEAALGARLPDGLANEPIAACEAERIGQTLAHLVERITNEAGLSQEQTALLHDRFDYLAEAAKRLHRKDWAHTTIGVCAMAAMTLALSQDRTAALWQFVQGELGPFIPLVAVRRGSACLKHG